jgi:hypothetical protein
MKVQAWLFQEWNWWVAQALAPDIASQGGSQQEALDNLKEAITLSGQAPSAAGVPLSPAFEPPPGAQLIEVTLGV